MEKLASLIIIIGTLLWVVSIIFLDMRWQWQMFSALVLTVGIFWAHFWEELSGSDESGEDTEE